MGYTRIYTQVYDSSHHTWVSGSSVEYAKAKVYLSGLYYSSSTNSYEAVPQNQRSYTYYSSKYSNTTWQRQNGVIGYIHSVVYYDRTGDISYYYKGVRKALHHENM